MDKHQEATKQNQEESIEGENINKGPFFGKRHVQAILLFFCVTTEMMTRSSLSLSIVAMTDNSTSTNPRVPTYDWRDTNIILSSFYWGYIVLQVMAGQLAKTYGPRWLLFGAMGINSLATTLVPLAAYFLGSAGVMACRILQGLSQGGIFPSCHTMLGRWAPKDERGRMSTFVYSGINIGTIVCLPVTGVISQSYYGWPASFYLFGGCGFLWCAAWLCFGHNSPAAHPSISQEERSYIEVSLNQEKDTMVIPTPWKEILTSIHFWALVMATVGSGYGVIFLQTEIPTYLEKAMKFNVSSSGYLTSMTAGIGVLVTYIYGPLSDFLIERNYVSRVNTRKMFEMFSCYGSAATMLSLAYMDESHSQLSICMFSLSSVFGAALLFGQGVNPIDLAPRFSGIILGFANSMSCLAALSAPLSVQFIVTDETNAVQWRLVFIVAAISYLVPGTFFAIFASAERQWWDDGVKGDISDIENSGNTEERISEKKGSEKVIMS